MSTVTSTFAEAAPAYRRLGLWPRPVAPGTKACEIKGWQKPDPELPPAHLENWLQKHATWGIGLLLGSPMPDDTILAGLDIDHDAYVRVGESLLTGTICGRIGARGAMFFVRLRGDPKYRPFTVKGESGEKETKIGELLAAKRLAVIPPTIHPDTQRAYRWMGPSLLEVDFATLPIIEAAP